MNEKMRVIGAESEKNSAIFRITIVDMLQKTFERCYKKELVDADLEFDARV